MISREIEIPEGVDVLVEGRSVKISSGDKKNERTFKDPEITIKKEDGKVVLSTRSRKKKEAAVVGTVEGHIKNMIDGVVNGVTYKLKAVYSHFPMTIKAENNVFSVVNFFGEKHPRTLPIPSDVQIKISGQDIEVTGVNKEKVAQTAAKIEDLCRVKKRDLRVFQDGIYLVEKNGKPLMKRK